MNVMTYQKQSTNDMSLADFLKHTKECSEIETAKRKFIKFATSIEGGVRDTFTQKKKKRYAAIKKQFYEISAELGMDVIEMIVVTNAYRLFLKQYCEDIRVAHKQIVEKYNIQSADDLDLRFLIDNRDYFIFWDSMLYLIKEYYSA